MNDSKSFAALGRWLQREPHALLLPDERDELRAEWDEIDHRERSLDDRLVVGLIGGTGVGKSTFINALAGAIVSRSGDRRPTTDRVVVYRHESTALSDDVPLGDLSDPHVVHAHELLRRVIVLDFPDFDSVEAGHREILLRHVSALDVLFVIVDEVKYADRRLFDLLRDLPHDSRNLFAVLNKIDRLRERYREDWRRVVAEIVTDLREKLAEHAGLLLDQDRLLSVSALATLEHAVGGGGAEELAAEFDAVREVLTGFRADKRRREAKRWNLGTRRSELFARCRRLVLEGERPLLVDRAGALVAARATELEAAMEALSDDVFTHRERLAMRRQALDELAARSTAPASIVYAGVAALRRVKGSRVGAELRPDLLAQRIRRHYRAYLESLANLRRSVASELRGSPLSGCVEAASEGHDEQEPGAWSERLAADVAKRLRASDGEVGALQHGLPLVVIVIALTRLAGPAFSTAFSEESGWGDVLLETLVGALGIFDPMFLTGTLVAIVLAYLAAAGWGWARSSRDVERRGIDARRAIRSAVAARGGDELRRLEEAVRRARDEVDQARAILADG